MQNQHTIGRPEAQCHQRLEANRTPNTDESGTYAPIERVIPTKLESWVEATPYHYDDFANREPDWDSQARIYEWDGDEGDSQLLTLTSTPIWLGFASNARLNATSTSTP
ncbi:hypothetical protein B0T13DRAFT_515552 [Neurospora crassa]|nr:hypothetical protein B0T13DRAFT_515552 [Neurospora crassa]